MNRSGIYHIMCFAVSFLFLTCSNNLAEPIESVQQRFIELPQDARRLSGPLFWLHGDESRDRLEMYVQKVAEGGNGCFTAESRPHSDWLGEGWYRDLDICLQAAKKHDLKMWIFDEQWWPSGEVGGRVPQQFGSKYMQAVAIDIEGPSEYSGQAPAEKHIATLAGRLSGDSIDGDSLIDLTGRIQNGTLNWTVPQGRWKIMHFTWQYSEGRGGHFLVDGASKEAVDWYINTVYQPHYDRFKDDFGTWIKGFFYDEPETYGDWGTEVIPLLKERQVDWKKALTAWKFTLAGNEQTAARYQYQDAYAEAWGRTLYGGITQWCRDRNVQSIGHFLEHRRDYLNPKLCAGNMVQLLKYSDMGGIDAVFTQFVMGKRLAMDAPTWQTPKMASSISHVYGKKDDIAMVEIFGARGQDLTYPEMLWWTNHMFVSGVNFHIQHSFNPRAPYDNDCPPYFYNGGFEPRWPLYRVYADYTARLGDMLSGGSHVCPVALLYLGNSFHVGQSTPPEQISEALQDALYDCDWMPYEILENETRIQKGCLTVYGEKYSVLIVPPVEVIPTAALEKAKQFYDNGGIVIGYGFLPTKPADLNRTSQEIDSLCKAVWGNAQPGLTVCKTNTAGGRSYLLPESPTPEQLHSVLAVDAKRPPTLEVIEGQTDNWLHVLHRQKDNRDIFFICNQNVDSGRRTFRLRMTAAGFPEYWDAMRAEITTLPFTRRGHQVELSLKLDPLQSALLVFNPQQRNLPIRIETPDAQAIREIPVVPVKTSEKVVAAQATDTLSPLDGCDWMWQASENAAVSAKPGYCYFRGSIEISPETKLSRARFIGTADNELTVFVNGRKITEQQEAFADWKKIADVDLTGAFVEGRNTIAISVLNTTDEASPAGLIGKCRLSFADGSVRTVKIDSAWKASSQQTAGWEQSAFNDSQWPHAAAFAPFGSGPWGTLDNRMLTLSPVKTANPFVGTFEWPAGLQTNNRAILRITDIKPEKAARISINGTDAGGCIGSPLEKDITRFLKAGTNSVRIEPFAPESVQVLLYSADAQ